MIPEFTERFNSYFLWVTSALERAIGNEKKRSPIKRAEDGVLLLFKEYRQESEYCAEDNQQTANSPLLFQGLGV